jgi:hypothetical protein
MRRISTQVKLIFVPTKFEELFVCTVKQEEKKSVKCVSVAFAEYLMTVRAWSRVIFLQ